MKKDEKRTRKWEIKKDDNKRKLYRRKDDINNLNLRTRKSKDDIKEKSSVKRETHRNKTQGETSKR